MSILKKYAHILLALILAAGACGLVWYTININAPSVPVITASQKLPVGTVIGPEHIRVKKYPEVAVPKDAVLKKADVLGKTVYEGPILADSVIRRSHLKAGVGSLAAELNALAPGKQAIDLPPGTATGLQGVTVGDKVDIYGEVEFIHNNQVASKIDRVAREAIILKVPEQNGEKLGGPASIEGAYVVAVDPEEAAKIASGIVRGKKFSISLLSSSGVNNK